ncbi:hypothetical protein ACNKFW_13955 (plasmid) [Paracoccus sp. TD-10]|uniref:hypothetical protein n=1 Tax=Paracoccus sp. TD-10 TaxID=3395918 RepID=UPI003AACE72B
MMGYPLLNWVGCAQGRCPAILWRARGDRAFPFCRHAETIHGKNEISINNFNNNDYWYKISYMSRWPVEISQ